MKKLNLQDINFIIEPSYEDIPVKGNAICSGDENFDKQVEDDIISRLEDGDIWAWANVKVIGDYKGIISACNYLGCCSYDDKEGFKNGGYYDDMKSNILNQLNEQLQVLDGDF